MNAHIYTLSYFRVLLTIFVAQLAFEVNHRSVISHELIVGIALENFVCYIWWVGSFSRTVTVSISDKYMRKISIVLDWTRTTVSAFNTT